MTETSIEERLANLEEAVIEIAKEIARGRDYYAFWNSTLLILNGPKE